MQTSNTLEDKQAIYQLLARYCFLLDGYRLREFAALFTSDGEWISRNGTATGPKAIEELLRGLVPQPAAGRRRKHFTANAIIELFGDRAKITSNFLVARDSEAGPAIAVAGTYDDTVVKTAEGWKFKSRKLSHDIAGESGLNVKPD
jgi:3-phenylpropionate/cinnamic acid dioxygenase small subunit